MSDVSWSQVLTVAGVGLGMLVLVAIPVLAALSGARFPPERWTAIGRRRSVWLGALILTALLFAPLGAVLGLAYWFLVRPELRADRVSSS